MQWKKTRKVKNQKSMEHGASTRQAQWLEQRKQDTHGGTGAFGSVGNQHPEPTTRPAMRSGRIAANVRPSTAPVDMQRTPACRISSRSRTSAASATAVVANEREDLAGVVPYWPGRFTHTRRNDAARASSARSARIRRLAPCGWNTRTGMQNSASSSGMAANATVRRVDT